MTTGSLFNFKASSGAGRISYYQIQRRHFAASGRLGEETKALGVIYFIGKK